MFGFLRRRSGETPVERLDAALVAASRTSELYEPGGFPDTVEGRFESLTLHVLLVLRRLRQLPPPAEDVAQDLVDLVFAHLDVGLRESGVGDVGVPKRMKKLGHAFYDRMAAYDEAVSSSDDDALAGELGRRLGREPCQVRSLARHLLASDRVLAASDLEGLFAGPAFPKPVLMPEPEGSRT